jgi:hypothetical protein
VGGVEDLDGSGIRRIVDFNQDGFPDFAVATTRGGVTDAAAAIPSVTLLINRPDAPGSFHVQTPIALDDESLRLIGVGVDGPAIVSGRSGGATSGIGSGGANFTMAVADFNADGTPDLVLGGTDVGPGTSPGVPAVSDFRAAIYLFGNETAGTVRVARPIRLTPQDGLAGTLRVADFDDDGMLDVGVLGRQTGGFKMDLANYGAPPGASTTPPAGGAPSVSFIRAEFNQAQYTTTYAVVVSNPNGTAVRYGWSGPNCGSWGPQAAATTSATMIELDMKWMHPHPPCPTGNHAEVTVKLSVDWSGGSVTCSYPGSETGNGPPCQPAAKP